MLSNLQGSGLAASSEAGHSSSPDVNHQNPVGQVPAGKSMVVATLFCCEEHSSKTLVIHPLIKKANILCPKSAASLLKQNSLLIVRTAAYSTGTNCSLPQYA